jgi:hypothetical protein
MMERTYTYFTQDQILRIVELSKKQFDEIRKTDYKISHPQILAALDAINTSDDYAKVAWRVQQENPEVQHYFDMDFMARGLTNLKIFYSLEIIDGKNLHSLSAGLDVFWHAHRDFSFDYLNFCDKVFGPNQFLHHLPTDKASAAVQRTLRHRYDYTRVILAKIFTVDTTFWGEGIPICCNFDSNSAHGFIFWKPALIAMEPACSMYPDRTLNDTVIKKVNYALDGYATHFLPALE